MTAAPTDEPVAPERVLSVTVEAAERGERLDRLLARRFGDLSRTRLKHLVEAGQVSVDGATIKDPSLRVKPGQRCAVTLPPPVADRPEAQAMSLDIRYEGFTIPPEFVVGYGLDFDERFRNLPYIATLKTEAYAV